MNLRNICILVGAFQVLTLFTVEFQYYYLHHSNSDSNNTSSSSTELSSLANSTTLPSSTIAISLMACARPAALNMSLSYLSLSSALYALKLKELIGVHVSLDCWRGDPEATAMQSMVTAWNSSFFLVYAEWFKEARQERDPQFSDERVARHWFSSVSALFEKGFDFVVHLEDDHVVASVFFVDLARLLEWGSAKAACYNTGCSGDCWGSRSSDPTHVTWMEAGNMGVVYTRQFWNLLIQPKIVDKFCGMRGNWDINVHILQSRGTLPVPCATYAMPRVSHMTNAGSARNGVVSIEMPVAVQAEKGLVYSGMSDVLVDMGNSRYLLETQESDNPLPSHIVDQCRRIVPRRPAFKTCILTSKRPNNVTYLARQIQSITDQARDINLGMQRDIHIVDVDYPSGHLNDSGLHGIHFIPEIKTIRKFADCVDDGKDVDPNSTMQIPCKVWQANLDLISLFTLCQNEMTLSHAKWALFLEDDVIACRDALIQIQTKVHQYIQEKRNESCTILKLSNLPHLYAMSLPCIPLIIEVLNQSAQNKPSDHAIADLIASNQDKMQYYVHDRSLFNHIGRTSTIAYRNDVDYLNKYESMRSSPCHSSMY